MRFLIDANLPRSIVELTIRLGHGAAPDRAIAAHAQATGAALLTRDLDFADVRNYPPEQYSGIAVFRFPDDVVAKEIVRLAEIFLREPKFIGQLSGRLAVVERDRVRFRPALF